MHAAEKISITLTTTMLAEVRAAVETGEYASTSEVLREALRVWRRERAEHAAQLADLRGRLRPALDDPRPGLSLAEV